MQKTLGSVVEAVIPLGEADLEIVEAAHRELGNSTFEQTLVDLIRTGARVVVTA